MDTEIKDTTQTIPLTDIVWADDYAVRGGGFKEARKLNESLGEKEEKEIFENISIIVKGDSDELRTLLLLLMFGELDGYIQSALDTGKVGCLNPARLYLYYLTKALFYHHPYCDNALFLHLAALCERTLRYTNQSAPNMEQDGVCEFAAGREQLVWRPLAAQGINDAA